MVPRAEVDHVGADGLHHSRTLVAEHDREPHGDVTVLDGEVGVADADRRDPHEDLVGLWIVEIHRLEHERGAGLAHDGGGDPHVGSGQEIGEELLGQTLDPVAVARAAPGTRPCSPGGRRARTR